LQLRLRAVALGVALLVVALVVTAVVIDRVVVARANQADRGSATPSPAPTSPAGTSPTPRDMASEMTRLVAHLPSGSVSVAARNLETGARFTYGSTGDQTSASIFKVNILEALMLNHQASGQPLSAVESQNASVMIVTSDNDWATLLYRDVGGAEGVRAANRTLGLRCTEPNESFWGLTVTCAEDQVQLLYQLERPSSPLTQASRDYILSLMQNVTRANGGGCRSPPTRARPSRSRTDGWIWRTAETG
jgi:Beta-lactamase enzyme family